MGADPYAEIVRAIASDTAGAVIDRVEKHFAQTPASVFEQIMTVTQVANGSPALTKSQLYKWIANAENNGLERALVRKGGRVYIHRQRFDEWLESR